MAQKTSGVVRGLRLIWAAPVLVFLSLACWAIASPLGSSPDDDFHLASTWCGLGDRPGLCEPTGEDSTRMIPAEIATSAICYAYNSDQSAACQEGYGGFADGDLVAADRGNFQGLYPPLYYAATGLLASPDIASSAIAIRVLTAALLVMVGSALFVLLPDSRRQTLMWAWLVTMIPLGVFIVASNNPSSWAVISSGSLWIALLGYFESSGRRRIALGALALLVSVMGAGARSDSAVYSALAALVVLTLCFEKTRRYFTLSILPIGLIAISALFYMTSDQGSVAAADTSAGATGVSASPLSILLSNLLNLPTLWSGVFGSWGLGWLDTPMPGIVSVGALIGFAVIVFSGLRMTGRRKLIALALVSSALIVLPSIVLFQARAVVGAHVQPRYILPLIILLAGVALLAMDDRGLVLSPIQRNLVTLTLIAAHAIALHFNMRRYISGLDVGNWNLNEQVEWWWSWGPPPMLVWLIGAVSFAGAAWILSRDARPRENALMSSITGPSRSSSVLPTHDS